jgi:hypothetical protein
MPPVARNRLLGLAGAHVLPAVLGALPGPLASGDPYYVVTIVADGEGADVESEDRRYRLEPVWTPQKG